jgi:hypothetical protein
MKSLELDRTRIKLGLHARQLKVKKRLLRGIMFVVVMGPIVKSVDVCLGIGVSLARLGMNRLWLRM